MFALIEVAEPPMPELYRDTTVLKVRTGHKYIALALSTYNTM